MNEEDLVEEAVVRDIIVPATRNPTLPEYPGKDLWKLKCYNQGGIIRVCFDMGETNSVFFGARGGGKLKIGIGKDAEEEDASLFERAYRAVNCILTTEDYYNKSSKDLKTIVRNAGHTLEAPDSGVLPCTENDCTEERAKSSYSKSYRVVCPYHYMVRRVKNLLNGFNTPVDSSRDAVYYHLMHGHGEILKKVIDTIMLYKFPNLKEAPHNTISLTKNDDLPPGHELINSYDEYLDRYLGSIFGSGTVFENIAFKTVGRLGLEVLVPPKLQKFSSSENQIQIRSNTVLRGTTEVARLVNKWWQAELNYATIGTGDLDKEMLVLALELYLDGNINAGGVVTFDFPPTLRPFFGDENWKCEVREYNGATKFIFHPPPGFPGINTFNGLTGRNNVYYQDGYSVKNYVDGLSNLLKVQQQHYGKVELWSAAPSEDDLVTFGSIGTNDVLQNIPFQSASKDAANGRFVSCVKQHLEAYNAANTAEEQGQVVNQVVKEWQDQTPPGRVVLHYDEELDIGDVFRVLDDKSMLSVVHYYMGRLGGERKFSDATDISLKSNHYSSHSSVAMLAVMFLSNADDSTEWGKDSIKLKESIENGEEGTLERKVFALAQEVYPKKSLPTQGKRKKKGGKRKRGGIGDTKGTEDLGKKRRSSRHEGAAKTYEEEGVLVCEGVVLGYLGKEDVDSNNDPAFTNEQGEAIEMFYVVLYTDDDDEGEIEYELNGDEFEERCEMIMPLASVSEGGIDWGTDSLSETELLDKYERLNGGDPPYKLNGHPYIRRVFRYEGPDPSEDSDDDDSSDVNMKEDEGNDEEDDDINGEDDNYNEDDE